MSDWMQHIVALTIVAGCAAFVAWQLFATLFGRRGKVGSCCSKGCSSQATASGSQSQRLVFVPVESLRRKR